MNLDKTLAVSISLITFVIITLAVGFFTTSSNYLDAMEELEETQKKLEETEVLLEDRQETLEAIISNEAYSESVRQYEYESAVKDSEPDVTYVTDADIVNTSDYLTQEAGTFWVKNDNGGYNCETWYSSEVLVDYRIDRWTVDSNGLYRDSDGYIVCEMYVANNSQIEEGDVIQTSLGQAKVYSLYKGWHGKIYEDANGSKHNIDEIWIYTNWWF